MTPDQEALDVAMVIADVAAAHQNDHLTGTCRSCSALAAELVPWMCDTARVVLALATVMDACDEGELIRTDQLRSLIAATIDFTPPGQRE